MRVLGSVLREGNLIWTNAEREREARGGEEKDVGATWNKWEGGVSVAAKRFTGYDVGVNVKGVRGGDEGE